jgi:hypothetical protein
LCFILLLLTRVEMAVVDLELGLVLVGGVFPGGQEHLAVCRPQRNRTKFMTKLLSPLKGAEVTFNRYTV